MVNVADGGTPAGDEVLATVFAALERKQIRYCLLRGYAELSIASVHKEIDLLVCSDDLRLFAATVSELGFVRFPAWGHAPHHFFVAFDEPSGRWHKLDVVTDLVYGRPIRYLRLDLARQCMKESVAIDAVRMLAPENELLTLLVHQILDKGAIPEERRACLRSLKHIVASDARLLAKTRRYLELHMPSIIDWKFITQAIDDEDWGRLLSQQRSITRALFWSDPLGNVWRSVRSRLLRRLRSLLFMMSRHGVSMALLAPDGAGKSTLAGTLSGDNILRAKIVYMGGNLEFSTVGLPTTSWLRRRVRSLRDVRSGGKGFPLRAANFFNRLTEQWLRCFVGLYYKWTGRFVVFDRYVYDALQSAPPRTMWQRLRRALLVKTCPEPDVVVLLDAPGEVLFARKGEHSPERLERQRQVLLALQGRLSNMVIVDATRSAEEVRREVSAILWNRYKTRAA